jgi:hypothetical protein
MSEKKLLANRQNAQRSTGPRTADGKRAASQNAVTHGLLSRDVLLPDEDGGALNTLRAELIAELAPAGTLETMWVDIVVACLWKWRRLNRLEHGTFVFHQNENSEHARLFPPTRPLAAAEHLALVLVRDTNHGDQLGKLARYEAMLERRLVRVLHELERLQAARRGVPIAPPAAVDVTISVPEMGGTPPDDEISMPTALPAVSGGVSETRDAQAVPETLRPAAVEGADRAVVPNEPIVPMGGGAAPDAARTESRGTT